MVRCRGWRRIDPHQIASVRTAIPKIDSERCTVMRARKPTARNQAVESRTGRDGRTRRLPKSPLLLSGALHPHAFVLLTCRAPRSRRRFAVTSIPFPRRVPCRRALPNAFASRRRMSAAGTRRSSRAMRSLATIRASGLFAWMEDFVSALSAHSGTALSTASRPRRMVRTRYVCARHWGACSASPTPRSASSPNASARAEPANANHDAVVLMLLESGTLTEQDALDRRRVNAALSGLFQHRLLHWRDMLRPK
jgi:hypothetical protein